MGTEVVFKENFAAVGRKLEATAKARMLEAVNVVRNQTLETLSGTRTGRTYYVPGTQTEYTASAPGEPPARVTSGLFKSIKGGIESEGKDVVGFVGTALDYGRKLEYGDSRVAARPWLRKSFEAVDLKAPFRRLWFT